MAECTRCGREHMVPRRFHTGALVPAREAALYVGRPEGWPPFLAHLRSERAHLLGGMTDEQLLDASKGSAQLLADLIARSMPGFLVLRDVRIGDAALTADSGDEPPGVLSLALTDEDGGAVVLSWVVKYADAKALISACRDQLGEPDTEAMTDCAGLMRTADAARGAMTVIERECEFGES